MKQLLILSMLLFFFVKTNAQNSRWMYLSDDENITLMVDTLKSDNKQFDSYDTHLNVVLIWVKSINKKPTKKGSFIESDLVRFAVDTNTNQIAIKSASEYHNNTQIHSKNFDFLTWQDAVPETGGDKLVNYCRALNNQQLMSQFILNANLYISKSSTKKKSN